MLFFPHMQPDPAMDPQPSAPVPPPAYPDAGEFLRHHRALGAAMMGAGLAVSGCIEQPAPLGGVVAPPPVRATAKTPGATRGPVPLPGGMVQPQPEPPPLPGVPPVQSAPARP